MKKWLCIIMCCVMLFAILAACDNNEDPAETPDVQEPTPPPTFYVIDFADGKTDFLMMNIGTPGTDKGSGMEVATVDGANALKMTAPNGGALRLGINVDGLLGDKAKDVNMVVFDVYAEYPDGNFSAVSGRVSAMSGDLAPFAEEKWQIYLASRNPAQAILTFGADDNFGTSGNLIEFACLVNGPSDRGETPAVIVIKSITFFNASNEAIKANTSASWSAPEGYGDEVKLEGWELPYPPKDGNPGGWQTWFTPGTDNETEEYMPWQVLAASFGIVFEMEQPESFGLVTFGAYNGWNGGAMWDMNFADYWEDGMLTIMWDDVRDFFDPLLITESSTAVKIAMGNWGEVQIDRIILLYDEDAMP